MTIVRATWDANNRNVQRFYNVRRNTVSCCDLHRIRRTAGVGFVRRLCAGAGATIPGANLRQAFRLDRGACSCRSKEKVEACCQATKIFGTENALRFVSGENRFAIDFMGLGSHARGDSYDVNYWVDDPKIASSAIAHLIKDVDDVEWVRIEEPTNEPGSVDALENGRSLVIRAKPGNEQWQYRLTDAGVALKTLFKCRDELVLVPQRRAPPPPAVAQRMTAPPPAMPARPVSAQQFAVEWIQPGGNFRVAATRAGPPGAPMCVHGLNCNCPGQRNYCGNYRNGETALFWTNGCNRPPMTIQCVITSNFAAPPPPPPRQQAVRPGGVNGCPAPGSVRSGNGNQRAVVHFANSTRAPLDIYWLDQNGARKHYRTLRPGEDYRQPTFVGHPWIAVEKSGRCRGAVFWPRPGANTNEIF